MDAPFSVPDVLPLGLPSSWKASPDLRRARRWAGLTLIELIVVLVCLAITAVLVAPMVGTSSGSQLKAAAELLVSTRAR